MTILSGRVSSMLGRTAVIAALATAWMFPAAAGAATSAQAAAASCESSVYASKPTLHASQHKVHASGGVSNSCAGWTQYCVYVVHEFLAGAPFPTPVHSYDATSCAPLSTGLLSGTSTKAVDCDPGYYLSVVTVFKGGKAVKQVTSAKYDYTASCPP